MRKIYFAAVVAAACLFTNCKKIAPEVPTTSSPEKEGIPLQFSKLPHDAKPVSIEFANGKKLNLHEWDSVFIFQNDMLLTREQLEIVKSYNNTAVRTFIFDMAKHWPNGRVPYVINPGFGSGDVSEINYAIAEWEASSEVDLVPRISESDYIEFVPSTVSNSFVGKVGGRQVINLYVDPTFGVFFSSAIHEIGHALGMFHEHSRTDRGSYIQINVSNIKPWELHNFQTYADLGMPGTQIGTFDFNSIMLYPSLITDASVVWNTSIPTMTTLNNGQWSSNFFLSAGDIVTAEFMYGPPFAKIRIVPTDGSFYPDEIYITHDIFIDFFANAACTIPTTLPVSKSIKQRKVIEQYTGGSWVPYTYYSNISLPTGVTSFQLEDDMVREQISYDFGNIYYGYREYNTYFSGFFR